MSSEKENKSIETIKDDLFKACKEGAVWVLDDAIDKNINLDIKNSEGLTLLHEAAAYGHVDICEALIENGVSVDIRGEFGVTPLMVAAHQGRSEVVQLLLQSGADLYLLDDDGAFAFNYAEHAGQQECLNQLRVKGDEEFGDENSDKVGCISMIVFLVIALIGFLIAWN